MSKRQVHDLSTIFTYFIPTRQIFLQEANCSCGKKHKREIKSEVVYSGIRKGIDNHLEESPVLKDWKLGGSLMA